MTRWEAIVATAAAAICLGLVVLFPASSPPRVAAALILLLFLPGYALLGLLLPGLGAPEAWMQAFVCIGLSLVITGIVGLSAALLGVPSSTPAIPTAAALLTAAMALVSLTGEERSAKQVGMRVGVASVPAAAFFLALGVGALLGRAISPFAGPDSFTTFAVVGPDGSVESLPEGEDCHASAVVTLQIRSHEVAERTFEVWQSSASGMSRVYGPFSLRPGEGRDLPLEVGAASRVRAPSRFELRIPGQSTAYRSVHLCADAGAVGRSASV